MKFISWCELTDRKNVIHTSKVGDTSPALITIKDLCSWPLRSLTSAH